MNNPRLATATKRSPTIAFLGIASLMIFAYPAASSGTQRQHKPDPDLSTPLVTAAVSGNLEAVRDLIERGADVNGLDAPGNFPLYGAVIGEHADVVDLLLKKGAKVNQARAANVLPVMERNNTALHAACVVGNQRVVELLINAGADINAFANVMEETARTAASFKGLNPEQLKALSRLPRELGVTPLTQAAKYGHAGVVKLLLDHGADVNFQRPGNNTALIEAAMAGRRDVIELLLGSKADINRPGVGGNTALVLALIHEQYDSAKCLLAAGAGFPSSDFSLRNFAWGIYQTILADKLTADGRKVEARNNFTEALTSLTAARVELNERADGIIKKADAADTNADKADKRAKQINFWIPVLEIAVSTASGALTDYSHASTQRQMDQLIALRNSKTPNQYFSNYEKLQQQSTAPPAASSNTTNASSGSSAAQSMRGSAQSMRASAELMRNTAELYQRKAATCDYLIGRVTKILNDETGK